MNFCTTALDQLKNWAVFAIFPQDEQQSDKYVDFVDQRYHCVIGPLRIFLNAIERDIKQNTSCTLKQRQLPRDVSFERAQEQLRRGGSPQLSPSAVGPGDTLPGGGMSRESDISMQAVATTGATGAGRPRGLRLTQSARLKRQGSLDSPTSMVSPSNPQQHQTENGNISQNSLKDKINQMSEQYMQEGSEIKQAVMERLQKCRKDSKTLYRWAQASLLDLHDIIDESLADELYFMVRGKMARILSTISIFEEAADQIERNLSTHFPNGPPMQGGGVTGGNIDEIISNHPERDSNMEQREDGAMLEVPEEDEEELDLRIEIPERDSPDDSTGRSLEDLRLSWSYGSGRAAVGTIHMAAEKPDIETGRQSENSTPRSGSTPEPPISPRPRALANHPKIIKLQSMTLPSKFGHVNSNRYSTAW